MSQKEMLTRRSHRLMPTLTPELKLAFDRLIIKARGNDCWLWAGRVHQGGYGAFYIPGVGTFPAHRLSYFIHTGIDPGSLCMCHRCDVRKCVRPDHLFPGTHEMNSRDAARKGRLGVGGRKLDPPVPPGIIGNVRTHDLQQKDMVIRDHNGFPLFVLLSYERYLVYRDLMEGERAIEEMREKCVIDQPSHTPIRPTSSPKSPGEEDPELEAALKEFREKW